jgi:hypothetical protein
LEYKPGDFFIGVIDFFGILIPGAIFAFLHGEYLLCLVGKPPPPSSGTFFWAELLVGSLLLGHLLVGCSVPLNKLAGLLWQESRDKFYEEAAKKISLPVPMNRRDAFYRAYCFLRIKSQPAVAEIDRQVADYKLFRSLTALFFVDIVFVCTIGAFNYRRLLISFVLMVLAGARYLFLLNWAQQLTFEYYTLIVGRGQTPAERDSDPLGG